MKSPRPIAAVLAIACAALVAACDLMSSSAPPCRPGMPAASELRADPALASLQYYNHMNYEATRGAGYDIWADSKFEYRAGLQFTLVPTAEGRGGARFCTPDVALRLAVPLDAQRHEMLRAYVRALAPRAGLDAARLLARLEELGAKQVKYGPLEKGSAASVEAGVVSSSIRGEFLVVAFVWSGP